MASQASIEALDNFIKENQVGAIKDDFIEELNLIKSHVEEDEFEKAIELLGEVFVNSTATYLMASVVADTEKED